MLSGVFFVVFKGGLMQKLNTFSFEFSFYLVGVGVAVVIPKNLLLKYLLNIDCP